MHIMIIVTENKRSTFSHVVIHNELEVFTAARHSHRVPLIVVELLSGIKNLRAFAWRGRLVSRGAGEAQTHTKALSLSLSLQKNTIDFVKKRKMCCSKLCPRLTFRSLSSDDHSCAFTTNKNSSGVRGEENRTINHSWQQNKIFAVPHTKTQRLRGGLSPLAACGLAFWYSFNILSSQNVRVIAESWRIKHDSPCCKDNVFLWATTRGRHRLKDPELKPESAE